MSCGVVLVPVLDRAGRRVERECGVGIEVVTRTIDAVPVGIGITNPPVQGIQFGIVRTCNPSGCAAKGRGVGAAPGVVVRLARGRDGIGPPRLLAGLGVKRLDVEPGRIFRTGQPDDDVPLHCERGHRHGVGLFPVADVAVPDHLAGLRVEGNHVGIRCRDVHLVVVQGDTTVADVAAHVAGDAFRQFIVVPPDFVPVRASIANVRPCDAVAYITPLLTSGVVFCASSTPNEKVHFGTRRRTVSVLTWRRGCSVLSRSPAAPSASCWGPGLLQAASRRSRSLARLPHST